METLSMIGTNLGILGGADGPTSIFLAGTEQSIEALIAKIVVALLIGILGLKIFRALSAIIGLGVGAFVGVIIGLMAGLSGGAFVGAIAGGAIICAVLFTVLRRVGVFFLAFSFVPAALVLVLPLTNISVIAAFVVGLLFAVLAAIIMEPMIIITTSIYGGVTAGTAIVGIIGFDGASWLKYALSIALVVICFAVQSMLQSRKVGKKEKVFSEKYRKEASMESEVERARMILDDGDEEEEISESSEEPEADMDNDDIEITEIDLDK